MPEASNPLAWTFEEFQCFPLSSIIWKMTTDLGNRMIQHETLVNGWKFFNEPFADPGCVMWDGGGNRWKATPLPPILSSRRVFASQPTLSASFTRMWCQDKQQWKLDFLQFHLHFRWVAIFCNYASLIAIEISQSSDDSCFHRKGDNSRLKSVYTKTEI